MLSDQNCDGGGVCSCNFLIFQDLGRGNKTDQDGTDMPHGKVSSALISYVVS